MSQISGKTLRKGNRDTFFSDGLPLDENTQLKLSVSPTRDLESLKLIIFSHFSAEGSETILISEENVNPGKIKLGPQDFELKKVLGKGGYGKVFQVIKNNILTLKSM